MPRYQSKPSLVEAVQFNGLNQGEVLTFTNALRVGWDDDEAYLLVTSSGKGTLSLERGDYVVKEQSGSFHREAAADFEKVFEPADKFEEIELPILSEPQF